MIQGRLATLWNHPTGPKTVHFWAPLFKWGLVIAGISDFTRPANALSIRQSASLALTGLIWSRWSLIIIPKNYSLFAVNFLLGIVGSVQVLRAAKYQYIDSRIGSDNDAKS